MKKALVTGGNRGIGLAVCQHLAAHGIHVFLGARSLASGEEAAKALSGDVTPVEVDVSSSQSIKGLRETIGELDILVNNAGVLFTESILTGDLSELDSSWEVHVRGPALLAQLFMPGMNHRGYGRIVNVSSGWGSFGEGFEGPPFYAITKLALNGLTTKLAAEAQGDVKVNSMCPGWVNTRMGGAKAPRTPDEGAETVVWLALLGADGPNGKFFRDKAPIPW